MTVLKGLFCVILTSFAVRYGWRMRGTVIGGEKGAMLPGMLAGLVLSLFAGGEISSRFYIPAAAGLIGMTYGGTEPYGDTIALIFGYENLETNPVKGMKGLALKGGLWFSVCGGILGLSFSSIGGRYDIAGISVLILLIFLFQFLGYRIFNQPYNREKNVFPKVYFAFESREEWGSNVGVLAAILIIAAFKLDILTITMLVSGFVFGAAGWIAAILLYRYTEKPMKNGRYLFGVLSRKKLVGGWGNMEYCLGSFGGAGIAFGFVICSRQIREINVSAMTYSPPFSLPVSPVVPLLTTLLLAAVLFVNVYSCKREKSGNPADGFIMDLIERPFFSTLPLFFILNGNETSAKLMTAFMLIFALFVKNIFDRLGSGRPAVFFTVCSVPVMIALYLISVLPLPFRPDILLFAGTLPYILAEVFWYLTKRKGGWESLFSLNGFSFNIISMSVQSLILCIILPLV